MALVRTKLLVDWNDNGSFSDGDERIDDRLLRASYTLGRNFESSAQAVASSGKLTVELDNRDGKYSPHNTSSPIHPNLKPGRRIILTQYPPLKNYLAFNDLPRGFISTDATLEAMWQGGGCIDFLIRPLKKGIGAFEHKVVNDTLRFWIAFDYLANDDFYKILFHRDFSSTDGEWETDRDIPVGEWVRIYVEYDEDSVSNNPTITVYFADLSSVVYSIGNGNLTETSTPAGTPAAISGIDVGQNVIDSCGFDDLRFWDTGNVPDKAVRALLELNGNETDLLAYLPFDEPPGSSTSVDKTGNGYDVDWTAYGGGSNTAPTGNDHMFTGYIQSITPIAHRFRPNTVIIEAWGSLGQLNFDKVRIQMQSSINTADALDLILDAAGWPDNAEYRNIENGITTMDRFWVSEQSPIEAMRIVERTESGFLLEDKGGRITFENRHHRQLSPHDTPIVTFSDLHSDDYNYRNASVLQPQRFIVNLARAEIRLFTVGSLAVLWTLPESGANSPPISPGQTRSFTAIYPTPDAPSEARGVDAWTTPVENTDYDANTAADGSGTDVSSDLSIAVTKNGNTMKIDVTNNGSDVAFLTLLQARGTPVNLDDTIGIDAEDATSQSDYGQKALTLGEHFIPDSLEGQDWAEYMVSAFKNPMTVVEFEFIANQSIQALHLFQRLNISDRITFRGDQTFGLAAGVNEDYFIERISAEIGEDKLLRCKYLVTPASLVSDFWLLGTSELGTDTRPGY